MLCPSYGSSLRYLDLAQAPQQMATNPRLRPAVRRRFHDQFLRGSQLLEDANSNRWDSYLVLMEVDNSSIWRAPSRLKSRRRSLVIHWLPRTVLYTRKKARARSSPTAWRNRLPFTEAFMTQYTRPQSKSCFLDTSLHLLLILQFHSTWHISYLSSLVRTREKPLAPNDSVPLR